jgi:hypothetical protein
LGGETVSTVFPRAPVAVGVAYLGADLSVKPGARSISIKLTDTAATWTIQFGATGGPNTNEWPMAAGQSANFDFGPAMSAGGLAFNIKASGVTNASILEVF